MDDIVYDLDENFTYHDMMSHMQEEHNLNYEVMDAVIKSLYPTIKVLRTIEDKETLQKFCLNYNDYDQQEFDKLDLREIKHFIITRMLLKICQDMDTNIPDNLSEETLTIEYVFDVLRINVDHDYDIINFLHTLWLDNPTREDIKNIAYLAGHTEISEDVYYTLEKLFSRPFFNPQFQGRSYVFYMDDLPEKGTIDWVISVRYIYEKYFEGRDINIREFNNFIRAFNYYQLFINQLELTPESILSRISTYTQDNNYFSEQFLADSYTDGLYMEILNINNTPIVKDDQPALVKTYSLGEIDDDYIIDKVNLDFTGVILPFIASTIIKTIKVLLDSNVQQNLFNIFQVSDIVTFIDAIYLLIVSKLFELETIREIDVLLSIIDNVNISNQLFKNSYDAIHNIYKIIYEFNNNAINYGLIPIIHHTGKDVINVSSQPNPQCNSSNEMEQIDDKLYPIDPINLEKIPRKRLVAIDAGNNNTRCYNADTLLEHWVEQFKDSKSASDPLTKLYISRDGIEYVQNLVLEDLSEEDRSDYYYYIE